MEGNLEILKKYFLLSENSIEEEIKDVQGAISNETLWAMGSEDEDTAIMHTLNVVILNQYLEWLEEIKVRRKQNES